MKDHEIKNNALKEQGSFIGVCSELEYSNKTLTYAEMEMQYQEAMKEHGL
jgi:hypothetical protein